MRALVFDGSKPSVVERPAPEVKEGWALLRTRVAGVCNTDLEILQGYMGFSGTLGHELVATVERGAQRGRRVTAEINFACGACPLCLRRLGRHCPHRTVMGILGADGAFAEQVLVPEENLHPVPDDLDDRQAVFVEPLAAAFEILEQVQFDGGVEALVLGDGKLGLLIAQVLSRAGASVLAVGKHDEHLAILREAGIATCLLQAWDRTPRDLVVEATGTGEGFDLAAAATRPRGTLVLKSTVAERANMNLAPLVINEVTVVGSRCGPFPPAIEALADGSIRVEPLIADTFALSDGVDALQRATERGTLKVLLDPTQG